MSVKRIRKEGEEVLYQESETVTAFDSSLKDLIKDLKDTLKDSGGVGLAAPQIGVLKRVVVINLGDETGELELINPEIVGKEGIQEDIEGCLSCPGQFGITRRPLKVVVRAQDVYGNKHMYKGRELLARAFCHEIDHLDGILFKSHVIQMLEDEDLETNLGELE